MQVAVRSGQSVELWEEQVENALRHVARFPALDGARAVRAHDAVVPTLASRSEEPTRLSDLSGSGARQLPSWTNKQQPRARDGTGD